MKLTREHHLVTAADLQSGEYDDVLKGTFDALVCAKHDEPLKLYCTEPSCLTPICHVSSGACSSTIPGCTQQLLIYCEHINRLHRNQL